MPEQRPPKIELVEALLAVHRVPACQAEVALEVERRDDLTCRHQPRQAGRQRIERGDHAVTERLPMVVPRSVAEPERDCADDHAHHVRPGRGAVDQRWVHE